MLILPVIIYSIIISTDPFGCYSIKDAPPGTIEVADNFFVDKAEITWLDYAEYTYWLKKIFGEEHRIYQQALIPYSQDSIHQDYPLVHVSYAQAVNYCQWRSDRVFEMLLVKNELITWDSAQTMDNYFTIQKFLHQQNSPEKEESILIPEYRLPTPEEWKLVSKNKKTETKFINTYTIIARSDKKIKGLFGSVAEMTNTKGIALGGSFRNGTTQIQYTGPSEDIGFRCVCSWK